MGFFKKFILIFFQKSYRDESKISPRILRKISTGVLWFWLFSRDCWILFTDFEISARCLTELLPRAFSGNLPDVYSRNPPTAKPSEVSSGRPTDVPFRNLRGNPAEVTSQKFLLKILNKFIAGILQKYLLGILHKIFKAILQKYLVGKLWNS